MAPDLREAQQQQDGGAARPRSFGSPVSESVPVPGPPTPVQRTARWLLALAGWSVDLPWPPEPRGIIVVYPHTSNWDFVVGILALLAAEFRRRSWLWLALAPEGTRARTEHWKSGFYHLALAAGVPVGLGFLDYGRRVAGVTSWLWLSGDQGEDLAHIRAFYADKTGLHPALAGEIRLRDDI